jgi:hypothetical protein
MIDRPESKTKGKQQMKTKNGINYIDMLLEWGDNYDGDLPELDPGDYATDEELEAADDERRRQFWRLTGDVAVSRAAWEAWLNRNGVERESEYWAEAEKIAGRFRALVDEKYWPIDCHLSYECSGVGDDPFDSIEGAGHYSVIDL